MLACADACVIGVACLIAWCLRRHLIERDWPAISWPDGVRTLLQQPLLVFAIPLGILSLRVFGLYLPWRDRRVLAESRQIANAALGTIVALIVLVWALGPDMMGGWREDARAQVVGLSLDAGRLQLGSLALLLPVLLIIERAAFRVVLRSLRRRGRNLRHVAVIGTGRLGRIVCRTLDRNAWTGLHVAYFIHHHEQGGPPRDLIGRPVLGGLADLERILEDRSPDAIYLALPNNRAALMPDLLRRLEHFAVNVRIVPDVTPRHTPFAMTVSELEGMPILSVRESPMLGIGGVAKRAIDVAGASLGLLLFSLPMALLALIIRLSSPGPVIFRQRRVSLGGEEFNILKFRTMYHAEDEASGAVPGWTTRNDPRVTPVGRLLRRTSLDELPQLFNVLLGDMSLVGPRPERPELIARFKDDWRGYMLRQHVKAGITGWAQINGLRGDTSLRKRLQHDLFYIRHWSLGFDLKILWLTLFRGFLHRNAH